MMAPRKLLGIAFGLTLMAATVSCSGDSAAAACSPSASPSASSSTGATALKASTTTAQGGPVVTTSFPTQQGEPFVEPTTISSVDGVLQTSFNTRMATYPVGGRAITGMTYAGDYMGPTLKVNPGDTIKIDFKNSLKQDTNFHSHGVHTSPIQISDNIFRVMAPGSDNKVEILVPKGIAPGTYWYHAHLHGLTEAQVFAGLAGALVVTGLTERLPQDLQSAPDHLMALRDVQLDGNAIETSNIDSNAPTTRTVNGQVNPVIEAQPGCAQLLRLSNMSADIWYKLALDGSPFTLLAEDANPMGKVTDVSTLLLPPGKRFDVLVRWDQAGSYKLSTTKYQTGPDGDVYPERTLSTFNVAGDSGDAVAFPTSMGPEPDMQGDTIAKNRTVVFSEDADTSQFFINGKQFMNSKPMYYVKLGTTEEWTIKNVTREEHPFHIHVNDFQIMSVNGKKVSVNSLQDTARLPAGGQIVVRMRFTDYVGKYVFHCHILAHEDNGMMAVVEVTEDGLPASAATEAQWGQSVMPMSDSMPGM